MKIKTKISYNIMPIRTATFKNKQMKNKTSVVENVEKLEPLNPVGRIANWWNYCGNSIKVPQKIKEKIKTTTLSSFIKLNAQYISNMHLNLVDTQHHFYPSLLFKASHVICRDSKEKKNKCHLLMWHAFVAMEELWDHLTQTIW